MLNRNKNKIYPARALLAYSEGLKNFLVTLKIPANAGAKSYTQKGVGCIPFDYIYLSAHGCADSFASEDDMVNMTWADFSTKLCAAECMNDECILMLSCCRGGLMQVAYTLFYYCSHISYVLGPRQSLTSADMHICFGVFLYNMEIRKTDPVVACEKIKCATDQRFSCYDREEEAIGLDNYVSSGYIEDIYKKICIEEENNS